jgi:hypothetical protein
MLATASGTFDVKVVPLPTDEKVAGVQVGRMSIDKQFHGDISGTSKGEMMTAMTPVKGSAGYVAIEMVDGAVHGRRGTFTLMHHATMKAGGEFAMQIVVVPDSGTGELSGLSGALEIVIEGGVHSYRFAYTLPDAA